MTTRKIADVWDADGRSAFADAACDCGRTIEFSGPDKKGGEIETERCACGRVWRLTMTEIDGDDDRDSS